MECQPMITAIVVPVILAFIGALISVAEMMWSAREYTRRQYLGGSILGAATCAIAGGILHFIPTISISAVIALGCIFGLLGHSYIKNALMRKADEQLKLGDKEDD